MKTHLRDRVLRKFRTHLLGWFRAHQRDLPWRGSRDPYRIWVAEIMLQQTRIAAVTPYYDRFLRHFPTVESLAAAPQQDVLKLWSGLGYYSRARNLHLAAQKIVADHDGKFPHQLDAALALPGGRERVTEGRVDGRLIRAPRGSNGFGYDPVFVPDPAELIAAGLVTAGLTTAEMSPADKDRISHRGKALRDLAPVIAALLG